MRGPDTEPGTTGMREFLNTRRVFRDYLYTVIMSVVIAVLLTIITSKPFFVNVVMSLSFGFSICTAILLLLLSFNPKPEKKPAVIPLLIAGVVVGMFIGSQVGSFILQRFFSTVVYVDGGHVLRSLVLALVFGGTAAYFFYSSSRLKLVGEAAEKERINRLSSEKAVLESNLRLLQAQVEPHFLFNTLSNILSLIDTEPEKGKSMLLDLIRYLRTSLSRTLPDVTTMGQEVDTIEAYLNIQKIRLGDRLGFIVDVPEVLKSHPFPPMLLQPLVENAVKHGLEPKVEGGEIRITVTQGEGASLRIEVADTGLGFSSLNGSGVGITNVKERIRLIYGEKGHLRLEENKPHGVRAVIEVPGNDV